MSTITLNLPEQTMEQARRAAAVLKRPLEELLADVVMNVLPTMPNVPPELQSELTRMTWLDNRQLWELAQRQMPDEAQAELQRLTELQGQDERPLTTAEQRELDELRREYGRVTLQKARAYALLSLRGGKPLLSQL